MMDLGLLILRLGAGLMMMMHGFGKVQDLFAGKAEQFPDPLGIGSVPSIALAAFAEFICALAVAVGFKTRWAAIPVVITMLVAGLIFHSGDDWFARELPFVFATAFLALVFTGSGRYSLDGWFAARKG
jgi:putative oxidoreductase